MTQLRTLLLIALILLPNSARAARLAVLEITLGATPEVIAQIADGLRAGALEAVRSSDEEIIIMTSESMFANMNDMGIDPSCVDDASCEVETARLIGADYVISATLLELEETFTISAKLHEVVEGKLLSTGQARTTSLLALIDATPAVAGSLLSQGLGLSYTPANIGSSYSAPTTSSSAAFSGSNLDMDLGQMLAEQQCLKKGRLMAIEAQSSRLTAKALALQQQTEDQWATRQNKMELCSQIEDDNVRKQCAKTLSEFYSWASSLEVFTSASVEEVETECGVRSIALEPAQRTIEALALLKSIESVFNALKIGSMQLTKGMPGTSAPLVAIDLGIEQVLSEQRCTQKAVTWANRLANSRFSSEVETLEDKAQQAWTKLRTQLEGAVYLKDKAQRESFITKGNEFIAWASNLQVSMNAGVESVETQCGVRKVAIPARSQSIDVSQLLDAARLQLSRLEQDSKPSDEDNTVWGSENPNPVTENSDRGTLRLSARKKRIAMGGLMHPIPNSNGRSHIKFGKQKYPFECTVDVKRKLYVDGTMVGTTPWWGELAAGWHMVELSGQFTKPERVLVKAGQITEHKMRAPLNVGQWIFRTTLLGWPAPPIGLVTFPFMGAIANGKPGCME
jgi:hypothetical protein